MEITTIEQLPIPEITTIERPEETQLPIPGQYVKDRENFIINLLFNCSCLFGYNEYLNGKTK